MQTRLAATLGRTAFESHRRHSEISNGTSGSGKTKYSWRIPGNWTGLLIRRVNQIWGAACDSHIRRMVDDPSQGTFRIYAAICGAFRCRCLFRYCSLTHRSNDAVKKPNVKRNMMSAYRVQLLRTVRCASRIIIQGRDNAMEPVHCGNCSLTADWRQNMTRGSTWSALSSAVLTGSANPLS